jgi:hypothetical protein
MTAMKLHAIGSTATGELALFWPEVLPADLDERWSDPTCEPDDVIAELRDGGLLLLLPASSKREHHLSLLVDEPIAAELEGYCTLIGKQDLLQVAGLGLFVGIDFLYVEQRLLAGHSAPGSTLQLPAGEYFAEVFATDVPAEVYESWLRDQAGSSAQRWWWIQTWLASAGVVIFLIFVVCLFIATREAVYLSLGISTFLLSIAWLMSRTTGYQRVQQARRDYHQAYPDFVVRLRATT